MFVNAPLRDYSVRPRVNDFTLPVLGMAYIATYAADSGYNVGVLDAEACGLGISDTVRLVNEAAPRWAGFNLLAPTYEVSAAIAAGLDPDIKIMLGGHQAKAMPAHILADPRMGRCEALIIGEAETRATQILGDTQRRANMPGVMWSDPVTGQVTASAQKPDGAWLAPDINALPVVDRCYLAQDPHQENGRLEANMVGARGCPYNCSFCGAAASANPDITIRVRDPENILAEMSQLRAAGVTAFRFVDDLFLGARRVIDPMMAAFTAAGTGDWARWDATGRINVLNRLDDAALGTLAANGLREVALGIESGSQRMLTLIDKRITPGMARDVVGRLTRHGIGVKGYFILGFPAETAEETDETVCPDPRPGEPHRPAARRVPRQRIRVPALPRHTGLGPAPRHREVHARPAPELLRGRPDRRRPRRGNVRARRVQLLRQSPARRCPHQLCPPQARGGRPRAVGRSYAAAA